MSSPPPPWESWEQCRDYYSLEAFFLGQLLDRRPGRRNERHYKAAAQKAVNANARCEEPYDDE